MAARRILLLGNPVLREVSGPVGGPGEAEPVLRDLRDTLHQFQREHGFGRGISAIQIGQPKRIIYLEFQGESHCLINPEWEDRSRETFRLWDDCFSFPGLMVYLERACKVVVRYVDEQGRERRLNASGALSELLQHEMDHLDGILAVDLAIGRDGLALGEEIVRRQTPVPEGDATDRRTCASKP